MMCFHKVVSGDVILNLFQDLLTKNQMLKPVQHDNLMTLYGLHFLH